MDFLQFAHQMRLRVQPAGGIDDKDVETARLGPVAGVVGHAGRVAALLILDDLATDALTPDAQLLDGGGTKRIAGSHHHLFAVGLEAVGQLGNRRRLARAIDASHHDDGRPRGRLMQSTVGADDQLLELLLHEGLDVAADLLVEKSLTHAVHDFGGGDGADVGQVEAFLQLGQEVLVNPTARRKSEATPPNRLRVLARPFLILSNSAPKTMWVTPMEENRRTSETDAKRARTRRRVAIPSLF